MTKASADIRSLDAADAPGKPFWALSPEENLASLSASASGLKNPEAIRRLKLYGPNSVSDSARAGWIALFLKQFNNNLVLILIFAAFISGVVGELREALIIVAIIFVSCVLSFFQEYRASRAIEALQQRFSRKALVMRNGAETVIAADKLVPGDIVLLSAGNLVPADGVVLESRDFNVSEAVLTGETFPVVKSVGISDAGAQIAARTNAVFAGTSVRSGTARILIVRTGHGTELAAIAAAIERREPETAFAAGIRRFGTLMTDVMLAMVVLVLFVNILIGKPPIDTLMFSLALAVGLTPELLPAIISVTLARGARNMADHSVIVRRLEAIENLGSMDMLCTDKTGTLTEGVIKLDAWPGLDGKNSAEILLDARLNACLQAGIRNPLDDAIAASRQTRDDLGGFSKIDEIPYDFIRKRLSVVVADKAHPDRHLLICKGAVENVLAICADAEIDGDVRPIDDAQRQEIETRFKDWSEQGYRVLAVARRDFPPRDHYGRESETGLTLAGFLLFLDPPKPGIAEALKAMAGRGIAIKIITGDNRYVAHHLAEQVGLRHERIITGGDLARMTKEALTARAARTDLFVEIDPNQKERIIHSLRSSGHIVGYLGDGINDAPALHEADVGISVDGAVDVARDAADMILLKRDLDVLLLGIDQGRKTFANTMKYIAITTSANFGNMISMAFASVFLPFLPLLAKQILLNNFLSDVPSLAIASDNVDPDQTERPKRWDIGYITRFMIGFGLVSTLFDFITFGFLLLVMKAEAPTFQTAWFVESLLTELGIVMVIRSRRMFGTTTPGALLGWLTIGTGLLAIAFPFLPYADRFGFVPLSPAVLAGLLAITILYLISSSALKSVFYRYEDRLPHPKRVIAKRS